MSRITLILLLVNFLALSSAQNVIDSSIVVGEHHIYFASDQFQLGNADVDSLSRFISSAPDSCKFYVDAHTDPIGSDEYNMRLSEKRTSSVVATLKEMGLVDSIISSAYYGESRIIKRGNTEEVNKLNRRARVRAVIDKELIYLKGKVFDQDSEQGLPASINLTSGLFESHTESDSGGLFAILSPLGEEVTIEILSKDYFIEANKLSVTRRHIDLDLKIPLPKLALGKRYMFKNMLFVGDVSIMVPTSENAAYHLKRFMNLNADVCIEIAGHINMPSKKDVERNSSSFELSVARALEIKKMLLMEGIPEHRLVAKGYGNWQMKFPEAKSEYEMQYNRRVEIGIIDCSVSSTEKDDEVADLTRYRLKNFDRLYNKHLIKTDIRSPNTELNILLQVAAMLEQNMLPEKYTYREIYSSYPSLPEKK